MSALAAEKFIKRVVKDQEFRDTLYEYDSYAERIQFIQESGYDFFYEEYEDAINHLKTESPTEDQANLLNELMAWWVMLNSDAPQSTTTESSGSCDSSSCKTCGGSCG